MNADLLKKLGKSALTGGDQRRLGGKCGIQKADRLPLAVKRRNVSFFYRRIEHQSFHTAPI